MNRPRSNLLKFFNEHGGPQDPSHGNNLFWPGTAEGFPFRGDVAPDLKDHEAAEMPHVLDYKSKCFRLWEQAEKAEFDAIMDRIVNGWYMQHKRLDNWVPEKMGLVVWLEWVQIYGEMPRGKHPGGHVDGNLLSRRVEAARQQQSAFPMLPAPNPVGPGQARADARVLQ